MMAYEFLGGRAHCGRPWHEFGVEKALVDCPDHYPANGGAAVLENVLFGEPGAHARPRRMADLQRLAPPPVAHPRADLLPLARARLARRAARLREPAGGERSALRGLPLQAEQLRRDGQRPPPGAPHPRARGLHRRPGGRARQGLLPDRDRPVRGARGDQRRQARRGARDRELQAVQLRRLQRPARPGLRPQVDRPPARRGLQARRARHGAGEQVRQRAGRRGRRLGLDRRRGERRQPQRDRQVLAHGDLQRRPSRTCTTRTSSRPTARTATRSSATGSTRSPRRARCRSTPPLRTATRRA